MPRHKKYGMDGQIVSFWLPVEDIALLKREASKQGKSTSEMLHFLLANSLKKEVIDIGI